MPKPLDKSGPVFRSGPNELSFQSLKSLHDIYKAKEDNVGKPDTWKIFSMESSEPTILSSLDDGEHAFKHRTISAMLAPGVMRNVEQQILSYIATFVDRLGDGDHDIQDLCNWLSFDIISELLYGESFNLLQLPELRWIPRAYTAMSRWIMTVRMFSLVYVLSLTGQI